VQMWTFNSLSRDHKELERIDEEFRLFVFQLPLSGSPTAKSARVYTSLQIQRFNFQLPLSGSRIDDVPDRTYMDVSIFQLPLSGSLPTLPRNSGRERDFQLPLSGSPRSPMVAAMQQ